MKKYSVKLLAVFTAVIMLVTALSATGFSAESSVSAGSGAEAAGEAVIAEEADDALAPVAAAEESATEVSDPTEETQAPTQAPTEEVPVIGKVRNLERSSYEANLVTLEWDKVDGATGYYVYICNADKSSEFKRVYAVKTNTCTIKNLEHTTQYHFQVSAYVTKGKKVYEGERTTKKTATQPGDLTGLTKWRSSDVLEIEWNRNAKATGYRVYRKAGSGSEVLYKTIRGNKNTSFEDTSVKAGTRYTYRVKSFRELYDTSYSSKAGTETFIAGMCAPNYSITSRCSRVNLSWKKNAYATHYEVYMSTSPDNSTFEKVFTTPRLYYNTTKLTKGKTYYFRVRPIYQSGSTYITGTSNKKSATITDKAYGYNVGSTYIEISIDQQHLWFYKDGKQLASTDVVTGNYGSHDTPKGYFNIYSKCRNTTLSGPGYSSFVSYWMAFYGGYGIHDSSWRSSYGNPIYKGNGSHGCVNTPYSKVQTVYNNAPYGTPVIIY